MLARLQVHVARAKHDLLSNRDVRKIDKALADFAASLRSDTKNKALSKEFHPFRVRSS